MTPNEVTKIVDDLQKNLTKEIANMMRNKGVAAISFVQNHDYADFAVDRTYCLYIDYDVDIEIYSEIVLVVLSEDDELLFIPASYYDTLMDDEERETLNKNIEISFDNCETLYDIENYLSMNEVLNPTDTLIQLYNSVYQTLNR